MAITLFWVVQPDATATPTAGQIQSGRDGTGNTALASGSEPYASTGVYSEATAFSGLSPSTAYEQAWVAYDDVALTYSNVATATITTLAAATYPTLGAPTFVPGTRSTTGFRLRFPVGWAVVGAPYAGLDFSQAQNGGYLSGGVGTGVN